MYSKLFSRIKSQLKAEALIQIQAKLAHYFPLSELTAGLIEIDRELNLQRGQLLSILGKNHIGPSAVSFAILKNILKDNLKFRALHVGKERDDEDKFYEAIGMKNQIEKVKITPGVDDTIEQIAQKLRNFPYKFECILIEDIDLIVSQHTAFNRSEVADRCGSILSSLAKELNCLIIITPESSRDPEENEIVYFLEPKNNSNIVKLSDRSIAVYGNYASMKLVIQKGIPGRGSKLLDINFEFGQRFNFNKEQLVSNQEFVSYLKEIIPGLKTTELYEILAETAGYPNWNIAKSKNINFYNYFRGIYLNK